MRVVVLSLLLRGVVIGNKEELNVIFRISFLVFLVINFMRFSKLYSFLGKYYVIFKEIRKWKKYKVINNFIDYIYIFWEIFYNLLLFSN